MAETNSKGKANINVRRGGLFTYERFSLASACRDVLIPIEI